MARTVKALYHHGVTNDFQTEKLHFEYLCKACVALLRQQGCYVSASLRAYRGPQHPEVACCEQCKAKRI